MPPTPLEGIFAAVTRQTLDDRNPGGWIPEQKITLELDRDITAIPASEIRDVRVAMTVVGGNVVYEAPYVVSPGTK